MTDDEREAEKRRADLRRRIDENLRRVYRQDLDEEVPERFLRLLAELRNKTGT